MIRWPGHPLTMWQAQAAAPVPRAVGPGLALVLLALLMLVVGGVLAFDVRGIATRYNHDNTEFTPWGRKLKSSQWPNMFRVVGWVFFLTGVALLIENIVAGVAYLIGRL